MRKLVPLLMIFAVVLVACNKDEIKSDIYEGKDLSIAIVGEKPEIREENVSFTEKTLEEISQNVEDISNEFDAVFIMPTQFLHADDDKFVKTYKSLAIPTFFIDSKKRHLPFTTEGMTYLNAPEIEGENSYAVGYLFSGTEKEYKDDVWRYSLYNDVRNEVNIKDVYTNIFKTINERVRF